MSLIGNSEVETFFVTEDMLTDQEEKRGIKVGDRFFPVVFLRSPDFQPIVEGKENPGLVGKECDSFVKKVVKGQVPAWEEKFGEQVMMGVYTDVAINTTKVKLTTCHVEARVLFMPKSVYVQMKDQSARGKKKVRIKNG